MVVIWSAELNGRRIGVGVFRKLANLSLCEDRDVYATKRRHLGLQQAVDRSSLAT